MKTPPPPKALDKATQNERTLNEMARAETKKTTRAKRGKKPTKKAENAVEIIRETTDEVIPVVNLPAIPTLVIVPMDKLSEKLKTLELGNSRAWSVVIYQHYDKRAIDMFLEEYFGQRGISGCLSPLHDSDLNSDGTKKLPHWHLLIHSDRVLSAQIPLAIDFALNGNFAPVENVVNENKMYAYHIHLYNRDKTLYKDEDRTFYNGYVVPCTETILQQLFACASQCGNLNELTVFCVANRPDLLPYIERYFRTLKAFYNANY